MYTFRKYNMLYRNIIRNLGVIFECIHMVGIQTKYSAELLMVKTLFKLNH